MRYVLGCLFSAVLGGLVAVWLVGSDGPAGVIAQDRAGRRGPTFLSPQSTPPAQHAVPAFDKDGFTPEEAVNVAVYESANKSVAHITTKSVHPDSFLFLEVSKGMGSGSVIDTAGHILTNYHVIEDAREVAVTLFTGQTFDASLVGADPINDVAVIKIDAPEKDLFPVTFGDSSTLRVGMRVFAIGNPFGLARTLTTGVVSNLNRLLQIRGNRTIKAIIQIDAAINPGNSGGPLLDAHGRLIGMNTAIASETGQSAGVGFAIPVNLVARVVPQLVERGRVIRAEIGIPIVHETEQGLLIARLTPNGPAERAGLRGPRVVRVRRGPFEYLRIDRSVADLITAVDGERVTSESNFRDSIESKTPGDRVVVTVLRDGRQVDIPVNLGNDTPDGRPYDTRL